MSRHLIDVKLEKAIAATEKKISALRDSLKALHLKAKPRPVKDYVFRVPGGRLRLSEAFGKKDDLLVIHNMGSFCSYCTLWADELNGARAPIMDRTALLVVNGEAPAKQRAFARSRGWKFPMASAQGTTFTRDMGFQMGPEELWPGFTTFRKAGKVVERVARRFFGPGDDFCAVWHFFDHLHGGVKNWEPKFRY